MQSQRLHTASDVTDPRRTGALTTAERTVWDALQEFAFRGPTCHPSQEVLAARCGFSRRYVNGLLRSLREKGWVTWTKARRPKHLGGTGWDYNVYTLAFWVPPLRARTLRNIAAIRRIIAAAKRRENQRRLASVLTKRTAGALRALDKDRSSVVSEDSNACGRALARLTKPEAVRTARENEQMRTLLARAKSKLSGPPPGAHGQRSIDGSYFSIWIDQNGHGHVGDVGQPPPSPCFRCIIDSLAGTPVPKQGEVRRATFDEARDFVREIEGGRISACYRMLEPVS